MEKARQILENYYSYELIENVIKYKKWDNKNFEEMFNQETLNRLQETLNRLQETLNRLQEKLNKLQETLNKLNSQKVDIESEIVNIESEIAAYKHSGSFPYSIILNSFSQMMYEIHQENNIQGTFP